MRSVPQAERPAWKHLSLESLLLAHGRLFNYQHGPLPQGMREGRLGHCYHNSWLATDHCSDFVYCEGVATCCGVPLAHAWVSNDGATAVDPTWRDTSIDGTPEYFGIAFESRFVRETLLKTRHYGVLAHGCRASRNLIAEWMRCGLPVDAICKRFQTPTPLNHETDTRTHRTLPAHRLRRPAGHPR